MAFLLLCEDCMARTGECLNRLRTMRRAFGTRAVALFLFDRLLARTVRLDVNTIVWLPEEAVRIGPEAAPDFEFRFLSAEEVEAFSSSPEHHLTPDFADRIRRGRDFCYAAIARDGRLAAYGWYALEEIEPEHCAGAAMQLPQGVAYMYKGYTHPDFRGARLHGAGMGGALRALGGYGVHALVSTVHWTNFASLRSCERLGYTTLDRIVSWRLLGRHRLRAPMPREVHGVRIGAHCVPAAPREPVLAH